MNREGVPGKSPEEMYIQQKVRVLLMLRKMGSNLTASEEEFLRTYAGVVNSQLSQLPQHSIDQGGAAGLLVPAFMMGYWPRWTIGLTQNDHSDVLQVYTLPGAEDVVMAFSRSETEDRRQ
ncbi:beta-catenin-interacting protein 1 isoform X1 [Pelodiscus sinensis]|uniref:beta-catenin-interacting protein 1 isoform X1 n=1 Tax=Pelodiscus sinensis TaxID=13735 RepID=UPI0003C4A068|nr:beta-catenin-interacting protein 1 isoform X1 [Pelodiscus sinensis]XP_006127142.1 beta-catenin-interacting protein 1 isoform X1 [Pelodiscus sinensis]XP_014430992.1 beta-catenin-interacting protein 1 isoform X1 [Pelodiscus sinensis]XP_025042443.1 beta-catenin-interacting protein 1 isoform X1 [Pelodiscus sinensis]|eukprot:XP_006127141.1 beta-catenin-interacting protein 1 isoform X1 [Pelodiscus sinensis]